MEQLKERKDIKRLWKEAKKNSPKTRTPAKMALVEIGAPVVPFMLRELKGPNKEFGDGTSYHSKALRILVLIGSKHGLDPLIQALGDTDREIRLMAVAILGESLDKAAVEPLSQALAKEIIEEDACLIVAALGLIGDKSVEGALIQRFKNAPRGYRKLKEWIVKALGRIGDKNTLEFIQFEYNDLHRWYQREGEDHGYWQSSPEDENLLKALKSAAKNICTREQITFELIVTLTSS